jgi:hypothetical protein
MLKKRVKKGKEKIRSILLPLLASEAPIKYRNYPFSSEGFFVFI